MDQHVRTSLRRPSNERQRLVPVVELPELLLRLVQDGPLVGRPHRPVLDAVDEFVEQKFRHSDIVVRPQRMQKCLRHL